MTTETNQPTAESSPTPGASRHYELPPLGENPSSTADGTTPGSFALSPRIAAGHAGAWTCSSPDTPGMPPGSDKTAWDFMPADWTLREGFDGKHESAEAWEPPPEFTPITQLEHARLGTVTPEMSRVAEREGHLTPSRFVTRSQPDG